MNPSAISDLLARIDAPGTFATRLSVPAEDLALEVKGVGPLHFPITARAAQKLRSVARPSPFGLGEKTLHDASVRSSLEVPGSQVKIAARAWKPALAAYLRAVKADLGLPDDCEVEAIFDKLLLYERGQFFKPHQDSEKDDEMIGTLVVILPSDYTGGAVTVEHRGTKKTFRRVASQAKELSLLAFYADCHHSVSPILSGVRVALTYQLRLAARSKHLLPEVRADVVERLAAAVQKHFSTPIARRYSPSDAAPPERLVYLLDHEYTQRSLSWVHLKNGDRARVAALRAVAERLDCECFLALAEIHETWSCEDDDPRDRYGRRGWYYDDDDDDEEADGTGSADYTLVELCDSHIELSHWIDARGKRVGGVPGTVSEDELQFTTPSSDLAPFKSEHEGYQGNYGNTVDRWYHRAAFLMWPRTNGFALRGQASPAWAVEQLLALPTASTAELESRVRSLLPKWTRAVHSVQEARFFSDLLELAARLDSSALARGWLSPLGLRRLATPSRRSGFAALVDKHGLPWAQELIAEWTKQHRWGAPDWAPLLADLCADLHSSGSEAGHALAGWLFERELKSALERCALAVKRPPRWLDLSSFADEAKHLAHVLAAGAAIGADAVLASALDELTGGKQGPPLSFLVQVLEACIARSPELEARVSGSSLHRECVERLGALLRAPAPSEDDWTITYPLACACADCKQLSQFLGSARAEHDWPLSKERRQHIHGIIDSAGLPVRHTTLRTGRPQVLQLRKDRSLFSRLRAYRARVKELLDALPAPSPRLRG